MSHLCIHECSGRGAPRRFSGFCTAIALALTLACRSSNAPERAAQSSEPERFSFVLPGAYQKLELRGEGSETLRAPPGARVTPSAEGFSVEAGEDFALVLVSDAPGLGELTIPGVAPVFSEPDLAVFRSERGAYSFVVVRELVPEWDESARQRIACASAGGVLSRGGTRGSARGFSKLATEQMVAACRTLELPKLE